MQMLAEHNDRRDLVDPIQPNPNPHREFHHQPLGTGRRCRQEHFLKEGRAARGRRGLLRPPPTQPAHEGRVAKPVLAGKLRPAQGALVVVGQDRVALLGRRADAPVRICL